MDYVSDPTTEQSVLPSGLYEADPDTDFIGPAVDLRPARRERRPRPSHRRFWLRRTVVLLILVLLGGSGWLAASAFMARTALLRAQTGTAALRQDLERGETAQASTRLAAISRDARRARTLTSSPVWRLVGLLPVAGETPRTVRGLAYEADVLSTRVLPRFVAIAAATSGGALRNGASVDIDKVRALHSELAAVAPELEGVVRRASALPDEALLEQVAVARTKLVSDTAEIARSITSLRDATGIAPAMLGADSPRRYFVALQTNAELRGSGGLLGAYAVLEFDAGRMRLAELGPNKMLRDTYPQPTPGLDAAFADRFGEFGSDGFWLNSNMSAHFPTVNTLWSSMYQRSTGDRIDGSIAVDPIALAQILKATGPAAGPNGETVSSENVVALTEQQMYARYPALAQDAARDQLQLAIARALFDRLIAPVSHDVGLFPQLGAAAAGGHIRMASNHPAEQAVLERSSVAGALPKTAGPYLQVALNNAGGTKLDFYQQVDISYSFEAAHGERQDVSAAITLRNGAPATGLPEYVVIRPDLPKNAAAVAGENRHHVSVYAGPGATLRGAAIDGVPLEMLAGTEQGHPVWSAFVILAPGQDRTLVLALTESGTEQRVAIVAPPLVVRATVSVLGGTLRRDEPPIAIEIAAKG